MGSPHISDGALVCDGATIRGSVTIGSGTVIFPQCRIECYAGAGPISIGAGCVVEEGVSIVSEGPEGVSIGEGNLFEVGCTVSCKKIGSYNTFQAKCHVGKDVEVCDGCSIGPTVVVDTGVKLDCNSNLFRLGEQLDEYKLTLPPNNLEWNKCQVNSYRSALANQGKKYYIGKFNKLLPTS